LGTGGLFPGAKAQPERDADHSPPSSAEVENEYELYLVSPPSAFQASSFSFYTDKKAQNKTPNGKTPKSSAGISPTLGELFVVLVIRTIMNDTALET
jgi:hypothetical protein